jgi:hypothetical protein
MWTNLGTSSTYQNQKKFPYQHVSGNISFMSYSWRNARWCSGTFSRAVRDVHNNTCHDRWIGRGGPTAWSARSPDLNPLDFYLWKHLKALMYAAPVDNEETLHRIVDACQTIRNCPGISERTRRSVMRRVEACIETHGGHFEHFLWMYSSSYKSQIECFRSHVCMDIFSRFGMWNSCRKFVRTFQSYSV